MSQADLSSGGSSSLVTAQKYRIQKAREVLDFDDQTPTIYLPTACGAASLCPERVHRRARLQRCAVAPAAVE